MQSKIARFIIGTSFVLLSLCLFASPISVQAKSSKAIETKFETSPISPKGLNDWYTSVTMVELDSSSVNTTYFQWNTTDGKWQKYSEPFRAWRGENTLYYYSVSRGGTKESIKSKVIKVDYLKPIIKSVKSDVTNGNVTLSVVSDSPVDHYLVYKRIDSKYTFVGQTDTDMFTDTKVKVGQSYSYHVIAIDPAGLKSKSLSVLTSAVTPEIVQVTAPVAVSNTRVRPTILQGVATVSPLIKRQIETAPKTEIINPSPSVQPTSEPTQPTQPVHNWNRLLVAISILVIAAGVAIGGYYGYEHWLNRKPVEEKPKEKKSNSRW